jgi:hypothetical protein
LTGVKKRVISSEKHRDVVVALPLDSQMALFLQSRLLSMAGEGGLDGLKLKIKPHPYLPVDALLTVAFAAYPDCSFVDDAVPDLLASCGLLITTASTVAFESVALGIKTLVYIPESVSWGIEYYIKENIFIAYEDDFSAKFHEAVASSNYPDWDVEAYFSRPDLSIFLKYLAGDKARP